MRSGSQILTFIIKVRERLGAGMASRHRGIAYNSACNSIIDRDLVPKCRWRISRSEVSHCRRATWMFCYTYLCSDPYVFNGVNIFTVNIQSVSKARDPAASDDAWQDEAVGEGI